MLRIISYVSLILGLGKGADAQSLLWKVTNEKNNNISYLYGTIHIQAESVFLYDDKVEKAMNDCDALVVEAFIDQITPQDLKELLYMKKDKISEMISKEDFAKLDELCKKNLGAPAILFDKLQPIMLASQLSTAGLPKDMPDALDLHLLKQARAKNKQTYALETIKQQMKTLNKMNQKEQIEMLLETVRKPHESDSLVKKMLKYYLKGDLKQLNQLMESDNKMPKKFQKALLQKRNKKMLRKMVHLMKKETLFVAVGAAHLSGESGLITLLRKKGYAVEPVSCTFKKKK